HELNRRAQSIASRTGQQATTNSIQLIHLHAPPIRNRTSNLCTGLATAPGLNDIGLLVSGYHDM
ncbi:hypothetical protein, partial [Ectopseudomonas oleovorans]|uniref:hypothetical protein n=1 Tax=Ectopseudomonas oleovorans TaxID=301 RepID=UPI0019D01D4F